MTFLSLWPNKCGAPLYGGDIRTGFHRKHEDTKNDTQYSHDSLSYKSHILPVVGGRANARKVVLLVTDGQSNIKRHLTIPNAKKLKNMGVAIYVVAVGPNIDGIGEMVKVAGTNDPYTRPDNYLFRVSNYLGFLQVTKVAVKKVSEKYVPVIPFSATC